MFASTFTFLPFITWSTRPVLKKPQPPARPDADLRREYVDRLIAADGCNGEYGMQGLMALFPKDF